MPKFEVEIKETLSTTIAIEAKSADEAVEIIKDRYADGHVVLSWENWCDTQFTNLRELPLHYFLYYIKDEETNLHYKEILLMDEYDGYRYPWEIKSRGRNQDLSCCVETVLLPDGLVEVVEGNNQLISFEKALELHPEWVQDYAKLWA